MNRRNFLGAALATLAITTGLARARLNLLKPGQAIDYAAIAEFRYQELVASMRQTRVQVEVNFWNPTSSKTR